MPGLGIDPVIRRGGLAIRGEGQMKSGTNYLTITGGGGGDQGWPDTLEIDPRSLNHDPEITFGDTLLFDTADNQTYIGGDADVKSSGGLTVRTLDGPITLDANGIGTGDFAAQAEEDLSLIAGAGNMSLIAALTGSWAADNLSFHGENGILFRTTLTDRLLIDAAGAWELAGDPGATGEALRSNGPGAPPTWEPVPSVGVQLELNDVSVDGLKQILNFQSTADITADVVESGAQYDISFQIPTAAVDNSELADMPANTYKMRGSGSGVPTDFAVPANSVPARSSGNLGVLSAGASQVLRSTGAGVLGFGQIDTSHISGDLNQTARVGVRINSGGSTFNRRRINGIAGTGITLALADDAGSEEVDLTVSMANRGANTLIGNASGSTAAPADIAVGAESVVGRSSGVITPFLSVTNSALIRGTGSVFFASCGADQVLRRDGTGALGFGSINLGHISGLTSTSIVASGDSLQRAALTGDVTATQNSNALTIANDAVTNAKAANMAQSTFKGRAAGAGTGDPTDLSPTQAMAIVAGTAQTWTNTHNFNGLFSMGHLVSFNALLNSGASGTINNLSIGNINVLRLALTGDTTLTGMVASVSWQAVWIINADATDTLTLAHLSGSSSAANQFRLSSGVDALLFPECAVLCIYDSSSSRWRINMAFSSGV